MSMTFDLYLVEFALGRLQTPDLPAAAMQALEEGYDSPAMAALAGTLISERSPFEIDELWTRGLRELGKDVPARIDAGHHLKRYFAGLVASRRISPLGAPRAIRGAVPVSRAHAVRPYSVLRALIGEIESARPAEMIAAIGAQRRANPP
jgi:hypothetical protein